MQSIRTAAILLLATALACWPQPNAAETAGQQPDELELPPREEIEKHKTYDSTPELQQTAGGGLIVNAFIMEGPVRLEIRDRHTGEVLLEKHERSLFPFEVSREDLGVEATRVIVRIWIGDELAHELDLLAER